jgi:hypothetical protein
MKSLTLYVIALSLLLVSTTSHAFRCGPHLISVDDLAIEVKQHCGEPDWIDRWYDELVLDQNTEFEYRLGSTNERWVYNLGPHKLMRFITIHNGRVTAIETGDYGFLESQTRQSCNINQFSLGMPIAEVQAKCGEPDTRTRAMESRSRPIAPGSKVQTTTPVDQWVYNLGPNRFVRILTFHNGQLVNIETGPRGF